MSARRQGLRLRDDVRLDLRYRDETRFGSALTGQCDRLVQRICRPLVGELFESGREPSSEDSVRLMSRCRAVGALGALYARPGQLREDCLYPSPDRVVPATLHVSGLGVSAREGIELSPAEVPELARWLGEWTERSMPPSSPSAVALWEALRQRHAFTDQAVEPSPGGDGLTFVGHATAVFEHGGVRVAFDPFLLPPCDPSPGALRPMSPAQLRPDAVFITHSHPDHYDVGSLLRLGSQIPIYVPEVERESLLAIDMASRLRALGFERVEVMRWGSRVSVGPHQVTALPFYGEQPTDGEFLHAEIRNAGNTYRIDSPLGRAAVVADAGRDHAGCTIEQAALDRRMNGPVDVVLGGYRAWRLRPIRYLTTSVVRHLLFVPRDQFGRRLQLMNDADDLLQMATDWGAHSVVPYANGGAPWYWAIGLGPRPGGEGEPDFDPGAQALSTAGQRRRRLALRTPTVRWLTPSQRLPRFYESEPEDHAWSQTA